MKIAFKLVSLLIVVLIFVLVLDGYILVKDEITIFHQDVRRDVRQVGHILKNQVEHLWQSQGPEPALRLIEDANIDKQFMRSRLLELNTSGQNAFSKGIF